MDGNGGPMLTATEITKAAKCLKDNPNFKAVYINPDLTQSQLILLKRLIKERTQKKQHTKSHNVNFSSRHTR